MNSAEGPTELDGAIGHFDFRPGTKAGLRLTADSTQFVVTEAKMSSPLSPDITHAKGYDQAARTVACIAWAIGQSSRSVDDFESLGFYVIAPRKRIAEGVFSKQVDKPSIREKVKHRISTYSDDDEKYDELETWYKDFFIPSLGHADIRCISWEGVIAKIDDTSIRKFYRRCRIFNEKARPQPR